jgi:hypothetical protein
MYAQPAAVHSRTGVTTYTTKTTKFQQAEAAQCLIEQADASEFLTSLPARSVDLDFGSPPYEAARSCDIDFHLRGQDALSERRSPILDNNLTQGSNGRQQCRLNNLRPPWSKAEGHCLRLALVLFLVRKACGSTKATMIDPASIDGAIKLINYFKSHARRVYGGAAAQSDKGRIGNAIRWIRRHGGIVTARKAHMHGLCKSSAEARELLQDLAELGHGTVTEEARGSYVFRLNDPTVPNAQQDNG